MLGAPCTGPEAAAVGIAWPHKASIYLARVRLPATTR